jgi:radical SAM superfamily enzyme YgiQ (UPF0313 family)
MLLIYPPVVKPGEPPAGIAMLSGTLCYYGIRHRVLDSNIEGIYFLLQQPGSDVDTWTSRARRNLQKNLDALSTFHLYRNAARYERAVMDISRVLEKSAADSGATVGLSNYQHQELSPLRVSDLLYSAGRPERNPFFPYFEKRLTEVLEQERTTLVGFSLNYLSQALCAFAMIGFLKKRFPEMKIILGGGLVTSWMRSRNLENPFQGLVDHIVAGPGEHELLAMHGIRDNGKEYFTPDYDLLPLNDYFAPGIILPYSGSSGCSWNKCSFCPERAERSPYLHVPSKNVAGDLEMLTNKIRPVLIHMLDNSISMEHMKAFIHNPPGVPWYGFARISRELADYDFCSSLKRSGCVMLKLGLESGDQEVLDAMRKGIDLRTASKVLSTLKKAGIAVYAYLIFGTPAETVCSARKTLEFASAHSDAIDFLNLAIFNMPAYGDEAQKFGTQHFYEGDLSLYTDFRHPKGWNRKQVRQFLENEFKRHPAIAPIVKREPPFFGSNHAPFFVMEQGTGSDLIIDI